MNKYVCSNRNLFNLKGLITTAVDDFIFIIICFCFFVLFFFSKKIRLEISFDFMNYQA